MGSVVKIAAMVNPTAPARRKASPTLPPAVRVSGLIAMNKVAQLSAKERNARTMIQPCSPIAYSLMNRHDGSSSGLMTCTAASRTRNRAAAAQDTRAAVRELAAVGVAAAVPFEMPVSILPSPPSLATLTIDWQPLRRRRGEEGIAARWADPTASHLALGSSCPPRGGDHHTAALRHGAATDSSSPWRSSYVLMDPVGGVELQGRRAASWAEPERRARPRRAPSLQPHRRGARPRWRGSAGGSRGSYRCTGPGCSARSRDRGGWS